MTFVATNTRTAPLGPSVKIWLVIDDVHALGSAETLRQVELFLGEELRALALTGGRTPAAEAAGPPGHLPEPLSQAETRVLRFLQTSLSAPEIARELYVSVNTVRTHMRHLYDKLGAHRRLEALDRARALGLLAPIPHKA
jgi:ATP/maltotriose-dependent transcriptional regulator MalT